MSENETPTPPPSPCTSCGQPKSCEPCEHCGKRRPGRPSKTGPQLPPPPKPPTPALPGIDNTPARGFQIRHTKPEVASFVARVVIRNQMDYVAAVRELAELKQVEGLTDKRAREMAHTLEQSPAVKAAIEEQLTVHGLDDCSKEAYVKFLWDTMRKMNEEDVDGRPMVNEAKLKIGLTSMRILGKGFVGEKVDVNKPAELPIQGLDDGLKRMMGKSEDEEEGEDSIQ